MELVWFRTDLRVHNNPALYSACINSDAVSAVYIHCPEQARQHQQSARQQAFIFDTLNHLAQALAERGIHLHFLQCERFAEVPALLQQWCRQHGINQLHCNRELGINERRRDEAVFNQLPIPCQDYNGDCVSEHGSLRTQSGKMYQVYTPFSRAWLKQLQQQPYRLLPAPAVQAKPLSPPSCPWFTQTVTNWPAGETAALQRLQYHCDNHVLEYGAKRDEPALDATSHVSAYLALGVLSPGQCLAALEQALGRLPLSQGEPGFAWLNELMWREFYRHLLYTTPRLSMHHPFKASTEYLQWQNRPDLLKAWQQGKTGFPLVDAAMRCLNQTGWMHNRLRMVVASFFTKDLHLNWRLGEAYFMQQLVDGDLAANNGGWQWAASTGADAAPYFRVFNPITQSKRFDAKGRFIRHWIPELRQVPDTQIHQPQAWLTQQGCPEHYPAMIVDHNQARLEAIAMFKRAEKMAAELHATSKTED